MTPETKDLLSQLDAAEWFSAVGRGSGDDRVVWLSSWKAATLACESDQWEAVSHATHNALTQALHGRSRERFNNWNALVDEIKPLIIAMTEEKLAQLLTSA